MKGIGPDGESVPACHTNEMVSWHFCLYSRSINGIDKEKGKRTSR